MPQLELNYFMNIISWGVLMIGVIYIIVSRYILPISIRSELINLRLERGILVYGMERGEVTRWIGNRWMVVVELIVGLMKSMGKKGGKSKKGNMGGKGEVMRWIGNRWMVVVELIVGLIKSMGKKGGKSKKGNMGGKREGEREIELIMIMIIIILIGMILILKWKGIIGIRGLIVLGIIMLCMIRAEWLWRNDGEMGGIWNVEMKMWLYLREKELKREEGGLLTDKRIDKKGLIWIISGIGVGVLIEGIIKKMGGEMGIIILSILLEELMIIWYIWRDKIIYELGFIIVITKIGLEEVIMLIYLKLRVKLMYIDAWRLRRKEEWWEAYKEGHKARMKKIEIITTMEIEDMKGIGKLIMGWMRCIWGFIIIIMIKSVYLYNRLWEEKGEEGWAEIIINYLGLLLIIIMIIKLVIEVVSIYKKRGEMWEVLRWWDLLRGVAVRVMLGIWGIERGIKRLKEGWINNLEELKRDVIRSNITWLTDETGNNSSGSSLLRSLSSVGRGVMREQMRSRSNSLGPSPSGSARSIPWMGGVGTGNSRWDIRPNVSQRIYVNPNHMRVRSDGVLLDGRVRSELIRNNFNNSGIFSNNITGIGSPNIRPRDNYVLEGGLWRQEENKREISIKLSKNAAKEMKEEGRVTIIVRNSEGEIVEGYYKDMLGQTRMLKSELEKYIEIDKVIKRIGKYEDVRKFDKEELRKVLGDISNVTRVNDRYGIVGKVGEWIKWGWDEIGKLG